jgi:CRP-like cAMP-binding protein
MHLGALPPAFAGLEEPDALEAAGFLQPVSVEAGDVVMEQGEEDFTLAFVVQGAVQLSADGIKVGAAGSRDILGEVELFAQIPRSCGAVASSPTHLSVLAWEHWQELCNRGNPAVFNVERAAHRRISERIRWLSEGIAEHTRGTPFSLAPRKTGIVGSLSRLFGGGPRVPNIDVAAFLGQSALFGWIDPTLLAELSTAFQVERFVAGSTLCRQGEVGDKVYVVVEGEVDVVVMIGQGHAERIATLAPGQAFGDAALSQNAPRSASCVCQQEVVALTLSREKYGSYFAVNEPVGSAFRQAMLRNLIHQLQATQHRFVEIETALAPKHEETLRGTPVSTLWRN